MHLSYGVCRLRVRVLLKTLNDDDDDDDDHNIFLRIVAFGLVLHIGITSLRLTPLGRIVQEKLV